MNIHAALVTISMYFLFYLCHRRVYTSETALPARTVPMADTRYIFFHFYSRHLKLPTKTKFHGEPIFFFKFSYIILKKRIQ